MKRILGSGRLARHRRSSSRRRGHPLRLPGEGTVRRTTWPGAASSSSLLYTLSQWREIAHGRSRGGRRDTARWRRQRLVVLGILIAINYIRTRQNKRWDLTATKQFSLVGSDAGTSSQARRAAADQVFAAGAGDFQRIPGPAEGIRVRVEASDDRVHRPGQEAERRQAERRSSSTAHRLQVQGPQRARHVQHRAGHHERASSRSSAASRRRCISRRATARRTRLGRIATATTPSPAR